MLRGFFGNLIFANFCQFLPLLLECCAEIILTQPSQILVFEERGNRSCRRKPLGAEQRTNKLKPHLTPDLGIEPGPHWWEASALTFAPSLHPRLTSLYVSEWSLRLVSTALNFCLKSHKAMGLIYGTKRRSRDNIVQRQSIFQLKLVDVLV